MVMTGNGAAPGPGRPKKSHGPKYRVRFAGEAFASQSNPEYGPYLAKLTGEIAWKRHPSDQLKTELSR